MKYFRFLQSNLFILLVLVIPTTLNAQFATPSIIAQGANISGVTDLKIEDLNKDGIKDVVFCRSYNGDELAYLAASTSITFNPKIIIDSSLLNAQAIAVGDLNNDQWPDIVACGQQNGELFWYPNNNGNFPNRIRLDSGIFFPHDIEVVDVDSNQTLDIIFIGQHSIDLFSGDGNGNFTKSHILTTSTSPNILELFDVDTIDLNHDSLPDLVTAETLGAVVYDNQGNGNFSPRVLNANPMTSDLVHLFDMDNDHDQDILLRHTNNSFDWFENTGNGQFNHIGTLANLPQLETLSSLDLNGDSLIDLYGSIGNQTIICFNDSSHSFSNQTTSYQNSSLNFIDPLITVDLDGDKKKDAIWSELSGYLAFQLNNLGVGVKEHQFEKTDLIYPNPATDQVYLKSNSTVKRVELYDLKGSLLKKFNLKQKQQFSVAEIKAGVHLVQFYGSKFLGSQTLIKK